MTVSHKKRIVTIAAIIAVVFLVLAIIIHNPFDPFANAIYIDYGVDGETQYFPTVGNTIKIGYILQGDRGSRDGSFYLALGFTNVSFSTQTQQPYVQVENRWVKFPFILHERDPSTASDSRNVGFTVDEDVTGFPLVSLSKNSTKTNTF
jgi:hypothetical protein